MPVTLYDDAHEATCSTLAEAVEAAKVWYRDLAGDRLPPWNYEVQTVEDLQNAVSKYKKRLAEALGYGEDYEIKLRLRVAMSEWHRS